MKQVLYRNFGNPVEVLEVKESDSSVLTAGQARIKVLRAPINPSDVAQIAGQYGVKPDLPAVAGLEGLGRVVEVNGNGIDQGQLVLLPSVGTWATEMIGAIDQLVPLPEGDLDQLSMLRVNPATAYLLLTEFVELNPGDWVIFSAANSAVGSYILQLAKARGINLVCVVRRESAVAALKQAGATIVLVDGVNLPKQVREATGTEMKLALDAVAGDTFGRLAETLEEAGTIVLYGGMSNKPASVDINSILFRDVRVRGFWLLPWLLKTSKQEQTRVYGELAMAVTTGILHAQVEKTFLLDEITDAITYTMAGERKGKVLLAPNGF